MPEATEGGAEAIERSWGLPAPAAQKPASPFLQGFVSFYVIAEEGGNVAISFWESKADADAFRAEAESWGKTLEAHGHRQ